jgi:hypothetical protein
LLLIGLVIMAPAHISSNAHGQAGFRRSGGPGAGQNPPLPAEQTRPELLAELADLRAKLETLPAIEQAKGALMVTYGLTADGAFYLLRFHSQQRNMKIRVLAAELSTLLSTRAMNGEAIARFDGLFDDVTRGLRPAPVPAATPADSEPLGALRASAN